MNLKMTLLGCMLMLGQWAVAQKPEIIPQPAKMECSDKGELELKKSSTISCSDRSLEPAAEYLAETLRRSTGYAFPIVKGKGTIRLGLSTGGKTGAYRLSVDGKGVEISGADYGGVVNGIATLRQLLPSDVESRCVVSARWVLPQVRIADEPRFNWRGMMLDCSRHFFTTGEVKRLIDVLALYKIDRLHWHLTDDQGWRIEIKKYPLLTERGAWRQMNNQDSACVIRARRDDCPDMLLPEQKMRLASDGSKEYGGFYTQDDVRSIVAYAAQRGIEIIPEIDMPGHSLMAINNYDGLSCFKQTGWGKLFTTPMCPGKDTMLEFCKDVWSEVFALFPSKYVHIGGDEVDMSNWTKCPDCQKRMADNHLADTHQLQTWFNHYMERFFNANGKRMIGWDEIIEGGLSDSSTVMWWRSWSADSPKRATSHGNDLICAPNTQFYLDYPEDAKSIRAIADFDPMAGLTADEQKHVLGVQGNLWTEQVPSVERMWYMAFPRMMAVAEKGWTGAATGGAEELQDRIVAQLPRLRNMGVTYRIPDLCGFYATNVFIGTGNVAITCADPDAVIHYTTDGTMPQLSSPVYNGSLTVSHDTDFRFRTFGRSGRKGDVFNTRYIKGEFKPACAVAAGAKGLSCKWYDYGGGNCAGIDQAPLLREFNPDGVYIPEGCKDNIGLVFGGYIDVPADGIYTFALESDDGSWLRIDGDMVVDNDGEHSLREIIGQTALLKGLHRIDVRYFDHNGGTLGLRVMDRDGNSVAVAYRH